MLRQLRRFLSRSKAEPPDTAVSADLLRLARSGPVDEAETQIRRELEAAPVEPELMRCLAQVLERRGDPAAAEEFHRLARSREKQDVSAQLERARTCLQQGDRQAAERAARDALAREPISKPAYELLQQVLGERRDDHRNRLICIGDSHVHYFRYLARNDWRETPYFFDLTMVGGATALGVANPNSKTDAFRKFQRTLEQPKPHRALISMLGEVDCGFLIFYRYEKHGEPVEASLSRSVGNYLGLLRDARKRGWENQIVCSVPPPTIADHTHWGEVANARREVRASQQERTELTQAYNGRLREASRDEGFAFLDFETPLLDATTGLVSRDFLSRIEADHHIWPPALAPLLTERLHGILELIPPRSIAAAQEAR